MNPQRVVPLSYPYNSPTFWVPCWTTIPPSPVEVEPEANNTNLSATSKLVVCWNDAVPCTVKLFVITALVAVNELNVPTDVKDEVKTFEAKVAPVKVPAGATTAAVVIDVVKPLALIVITGIAVLPPVVPADATEANVVTFPAEVTSPVKLALVVTVDARLELKAYEADVAGLVLVNIFPFT